MTQPEQSTATASAAQISLMRLSASRPRRSTSTATDTLSTESKLTADRRGIGSSMGSRTTSLAKPRIVVVQGATSALCSRGMAASRDKTTTGRLPTSASSHHQTSPRSGSVITKPLQPAEKRRGRPSRPARRVGARRRPHSLRRLRPSGDASAAPQGPRRQAQRRSYPGAGRERSRAAADPRSCSVVCESCHKHATAPHSVPRRRDDLSPNKPAARRRRNGPAPIGRKQRNGHSR